MLILGFGIFGYSFKNINLATLLQDVFIINWWWMLVAFICICLYLGLEAVVVKVLMGKSHKNFTWKDACRLPPIEQLFNGITPFAAGGQPAQLVAMIQSGVDGGFASSILLMKFIFLLEICCLINY